MDIRKVKKLIELLEESDIAELEIKEGEESIRISRYSYPEGTVMHTSLQERPRQTREPTARNRGEQTSKRSRDTFELVGDAD